MKHKDINGWIVIVGQPVFTCRTRKQAREYTKKYKQEKIGHQRRYNYIGKSIKNYRQIILDV